LRIDLTGFQNRSGLKPPHRYFSNLFTAYTKAFNKRNKRHGSLFEPPFKQRLIEDEVDLKQLVLYIHNHLVHHGFCSHPLYSIAAMKTYSILCMLSVLPLLNLLFAICFS